MALSPHEFEEHLERCVMSDAEIHKFVEDLALIRLTLIVRELNLLTSSSSLHAPLASEHRIDWTDEELLIESGIEPSWISGLSDPGSVYLHIETAVSGDWALVARYREAAFLSEKQERVLLPSLRRARRPKQPREAFVGEVRRLNGILRWAASSALSWEAFHVYRAHIRIHGASQNETAIVGAEGATLAILDAIREIAHDEIFDVYGEPLPPGVRTPVEIATYRTGQPRGRPRVRAVLLANGRAVAFPADPDIVIFQALGSQQFQTAREAWEAFDQVRTDRDRSSRLHLFAVGEVKTATDTSSLHERSALARRDPGERVDRFLMMAILPRQFLFDPGGGRRRRSAFNDRGVRDLAHLFNLYFAWGYDGAREDHPEHWNELKRQLAGWCGLPN